MNNVQVSRLSVILKQGGEGRFTGPWYTEQYQDTDRRSFTHYPRCTRIQTEDPSHIYRSGIGFKNKQVLGTIAIHEDTNKEHFYKTLNIGCISLQRKLLFKSKIVEFLFKTEIVELLFKTEIVEFLFKTEIVELLFKTEIVEFLFKTEKVKGTADVILSDTPSIECNVPYPMHFKPLSGNVTCPCTLNLCLGM